MGIVGVWACGLRKLTEPKGDYRNVNKPFTDRQLISLFLPLLGEQILVMLVGVLDTMMVSYVGEAAVSGVSLVDMLNNVFLYLFRALAAAGVVVVSQCIGGGEKENAADAAGQLLRLAAGISIAVTGAVILFGGSVINFLYGNAEEEVRQAGKIYLLISACSFPFTAIQSSCAALQRSMGKTRVTMDAAVMMNLINVTGNAAAIFVLHAGVSGIACASLISRMFAAVWLLALCFRKSNAVVVSWKGIFTVRHHMTGRILSIAVPNGIENGLVQFSKTVLSGMISGFGTVQIAAYGISNSLTFLASALVIAMDQAVLPVIGQCTGAGNPDGAGYYTKKFVRMTFVFSGIWNLAVFLAAPAVLSCYSLNRETRETALFLVGANNLLNTLLFSIAGPVSASLRASGDVKYTMKVIVFATAVCRMAAVGICGIGLGWGIYGICAGKLCDWSVRAVLLTIRCRRLSESCETSKKTWNLASAVRREDGQ